MKKPASLRNPSQRIARWLFFVMLLGASQVICAEACAQEPVNSASEIAWSFESVEDLQAVLNQDVYFKGNKAEALRSQFMRHAFSLEFDREDAFRVIYMFYAFVLYLFYFTVRYKLMRHA